ncbi:MAG: hypothetical protein ACRDRZ_01040 [Pseudonocardiaceae bacterium]
MFVADRYSGSSRLRVLQYVELLRADGHQVTVCRTVPSRNWRPPVAWPAVLRGLCLLLATVLLVVQRCWQILVSVPGRDVVLLQKSLSYRLPWLRLERLLIARARRHGARVVHDVDDAIHIGSSAGPRRITGREAAHAARASDLVLAGSPHLAGELRTLGARVAYLPTCVPEGRRPGRRHPFGERLVLCWTGVPTNLGYLTGLFPSLRELAARIPLCLVVVTRLSAARLPEPPGLAVGYVPWSPANERAVLARSHVGLAPLPASDWTAGKCGARLLAYQAAGLPSVASPVGVQRDLAQHEVTALVATSPGSWQHAVARLATDEQLYQRVAAGAVAMAGRYAPERWYPMWSNLVLGDGSTHGYDPREVTP